MGKLKPKISCYLWTIIKDSSSQCSVSILSLSRDQSKSCDKDRWDGREKFNWVQSSPVLVANSSNKKGGVKKKEKRGLVTFDEFIKCKR